MLLGQTDSLATKPNKTDLRPVASCGVVTAIKTKSKANIWSPEMQGKTPFLLGGSNIRKQRKRGLAWRKSLRARRKGFCTIPVRAILSTHSDEQHANSTRSGRSFRYLRTADPNGVLVSLCPTMQPAGGDRLRAVAFRWLELDVWILCGRRPGFPSRMFHRRCRD